MDNAGRVERLNSRGLASNNHRGVTDGMHILFLCALSNKGLILLLVKCRRLQFVFETMAREGEFNEYGAGQQPRPADALRFGPVALARVPSLCSARLTRSVGLVVVMANAVRPSTKARAVHKAISA